MKLLLKPTAHICFSLFLLASIVFAFSPKLFAATLQLTNIGALATEGNVYPEWWYTGSNPALLGKAAANSEVTVKIDDTSSKVKANGSGDWSYNTTISSGDHMIVISQGSETISFTLHAGQALPENIGQTTQSTAAGTTPDTGHDQYIALAFGVGIILLATYLYVWGDNRRRSVFEAKIIKD